jgi:hypothetical protein
MPKNVTKASPPKASPTKKSSTAKTATTKTASAPKRAGKEHDPGPELSAKRGEAQADAARHPLTVEQAIVRLGTASWTDPTMVAPGVFYPREADTPEERLRFYADQFPIVEVDATYYALPTRRQGELWMERTPPDFTFDIKP